MMSQRSKREMIESIHPRYLKANKAEKQHILDEFIATSRIEEAGASESLPGRSGSSFGTNLGNLWTRMFETPSAVSA